MNSFAPCQSLLEAPILAPKAKTTRPGLGLAGFFSGDLGCLNRVIPRQRSLLGPPSAKAPIPDICRGPMRL
jgi:hypothetical protein